MTMTRRLLATTLLLTLFPALAGAGGWKFPEEGPNRFHLRDVFQLEWASTPQLSPDGERIVYVRNAFDVMKDRRRGALWLLEPGSGEHRPLFSAPAGASDGSPLFSPDGSKILFTRSDEEGTQLMLFDSSTGITARLTQLTESPRAMAFSGDGEWIALTLFVPQKSPKMVDLPDPPEGAEWAPRPKVIDDVVYRADGAGYL